MPGDKIRKKAQNARYTHGLRYRSSLDEMERRFGWVIDEMMLDVELQAIRGCRYCRRPFADIADVTIDVIDPTRPPYWRTNVAICCLLCNQSKARQSPDDWEARLYRRPDRSQLVLELEVLD